LVKSVIIRQIVNPCHLDETTVFDLLKFEQHYNQTKMTALNEFDDHVKNLRSKNRHITNIAELRHDFQNQFGKDMSLINAITFQDFAYEKLVTSFESKTLDF